MGDETAHLPSLLSAAGLCAAVVAAAWSRHRRSWRRRQHADREWLRAAGIDPGAPRPDPAAWRLVITDDLAADGTFTTLPTA